MMKFTQNAVTLALTLGTSAVFAGEPPVPETPLSGDMPGLLALGAVALVIGVQALRRGKRK